MNSMDVVKQVLIFNAAGKIDTVLSNAHWGDFVIHLIGAMIVFFFFVNTFRMRLV